MTHCVNSLSIISGNSNRTRDNSVGGHFKMSRDVKLCFRWFAEVSWCVTSHVFWELLKQNTLNSHTTQRNGFKYPILVFYVEYDSANNSCLIRFYLYSRDGKVKTVFLCRVYTIMQLFVLTCDLYPNIYPF